MAIICPDGVGPGELVVFETPDGRELEAKVPEGVVEGEEFEVEFEAAVAQAAEQARMDTNRQEEALSLDYYKNMDARVRKALEDEEKARQEKARQEKARRMYGKQASHRPQPASTSVADRGPLAMFKMDHSPEHGGRGLRGQRFSRTPQLTPDQKAQQKYNIEEIKKIWIANEKDPTSQGLTQTLKNYEGREGDLLEKVRQRYRKSTPAEFGGGGRPKKKRKSKKRKSKKRKSKKRTYRRRR